MHGSAAGGPRPLAGWPPDFLPCHRHGALRARTLCAGLENLTDGHRLRANVSKREERTHGERASLRDMRRSRFATLRSSEGRLGPGPLGSALGPVEGAARRAGAGAFWARR